MKTLIAALALLLAVAPLSARAEVFVWKDPQFDIKMTYPDNWMRQPQPDDPYLRLHVLAPQGLDHAACRLYATHDGRFMDAPAYANQQVSTFVFTGEEIKREIFNRRDTNMISMSSYSNGGSLGAGAAVMAEVDFQKYWNGAAYPMHGMVLATQHYGDRIVMSCETLASAWPRWEQAMKSIFKSVSFAPAFAPEPNGLYRRFQDDGGVILPLNRRKDGYTTR